MNKSLYLHAASGGRKAASNMTAAQRSLRGTKAIWARWHPLTPEQQEALRAEEALEARELASQAEDRYKSLAHKYQILRRFIEQKGGDPDDIISEAASQVSEASE